MALPRSLLKIFLSFVLSVAVSAETYIARVGTENHVNVISKNFLSFTVDPKYLFSRTEKYGSSRESICMAASLAPAYLRIAGPSTAHVTFHNSTISIDPPDTEDRYSSIFQKKENRFKEFDESFERDAKKFLEKVLARTRQKRRADREDLSEKTMILERLLRGQKKVEVEKVRVTSDKWKRFSAWAKAAGFEIVFALNNEEKSDAGLWDPATTLDILSVAEKEGVGNIFWQLGYECAHQSIDEYLTDLQTLRVIVDSSPGRARGWRVVGADVTRCLRKSSRSDFKDYVALSLDMTDALMLNGNSSSYELERLSPFERQKLLRLVHSSGVPLWVSEGARAEPNELNEQNELNEPNEPNELSELERAAGWMASLGHSARRGAQVHFRELTAHELYQPTLSFYMALLFKNLVGERVLNVDMESQQSVLFAHCTSLRHQPVPGAVTLYGANMDEEPARLSLKLSKREEGGDIMQIILSQDDSGNIIVNGRVMSQEGDIRPVVRRVRPYKTLLLNLPAKSFGFWVLANTKIEPCQNHEEKDNGIFVESELVDTVDVASNNVRRRRSLVNATEETITDKGNRLDEFDIAKTGHEKLDKAIENLSNYLREMHSVLRKKPAGKVRRQVSDGQTKKLRRQLLKIRNDLKIVDENKPVLSFIGNLLQIARNGTKHIDNDRLRNLKLHGNRIGKRHNPKEMFSFKNTAKRSHTKNLDAIEESSSNKRTLRARRSVLKDTNEDFNGKTEDAEANDVINIKDNIDKSHEFPYDGQSEFETDHGKSSKFGIFDKYDSVMDNEVEANTNDNKKIWEALYNIQSQLKKISEENKRNKEIESENAKKNDEDRLIVKTEISDEGTTINFKEHPNGGWVKSTFENIFYTLNDFNESVNKLWEALSILE